MTNTGTLEATNGGTLNLGGTFNNTGGTILAAGNDGAGTNSTVNLGGAAASTINGGTLSTTGTGVMTIGGSTLNGVTIGAGSTVTLANNTAAILQGTITNGGTIAVDSAGNVTDVKLDGAVTLSGGTVTMSDSTANRIYGITGSDSLTITSGTTIQGAGQVGINNGSFAFTLTNNGTIDANQSSALSVAPTTPVANNATLEATAGGTLNLVGTFNNSSTGLILSTGSGSTVNLNGATITGGTLTTTSGGVIQNNGSMTLDGSTSSPTISSGSTLTILNNTTTTLLGTIINDGTIAQNSAGNVTDVKLSGPVTLDGTGALVFSDNSANRIYGVSADAALINGANHTIEGAGQIGINNGGSGFAFTNNGTIIANASNTLQIAPSSVTTNNGTMQVNNGSVLEVLGGLTTSGTVNVGQPGHSGTATFLMGDGHDFVQTGGTTTLWTAGSILQLQSGQAVDLQGGTLQGIGTIMGNLSNTGGTVMPGTPGVGGVLTVTGNYSDLPSSQLFIQIGGPDTLHGLSQLDVGGTATLAGSLDVDMINGFVPAVNQEFVILTSGGLSGSFTDNTIVVHEGNLIITFDVLYSPQGFNNDVVLDTISVVQSVPEPGSIVMLGLGAIGAGALVVRRSRAARRQ